MINNLIYLTAFLDLKEIKNVHEIFLFSIFQKTKTKIWADQITILETILIKIFEKKIWIEVSTTFLIAKFLSGVDSSNNRH